MKRYLRVAAWAGIWLLVVLCRHSFPSITAVEYGAFALLLLVLCAIDLSIAWWPERTWPAWIRRHAYTLLVIMLLMDMARAGYYLTQHHPFDPYLQMPPHRYVLPHKDSNEVRILCLGGSTTAGLSLADTLRYPYRLQQRLQARYPQLKVRVINLGMDWYTSKHLVTIYTTEGRYYQPDIVVCMEAINDMYRSWSPRGFAVGAYNDEYAHFYGPAYNGAEPPTMEYHLLSHSHWGDLPLLLMQQHRVAYRPSEWRSVGPYIRHLSALARYVAADSAAFYLVTQPNLYKPQMTEEEERLCWFGQLLCNRRVGWHTLEYPDLASMRAAMDTFLYEERRMAAAQHIPLIDAAAMMPRTLKYFYDDVHCYSPGADSLSHVVADAIGEELKKHVR